jgi:hypothetical protein
MRINDCEREIQVLTERIAENVEKSETIVQQFSNSISHHRTECEKRVKTLHEQILILEDQKIKMLNIVNK